MVKFFNWFLIVLTLSVIFLLNACYRHDSLSNIVTFEGEVFYGTINSSGVVVVGGLSVGTKVFCEGFEGYALTNDQGKYTLKVSPAQRRFDLPGTDTYTLRAEDGTGGDEKITVKAKGGETIYVRPFLIYQHSYE